MFKKVILLAVCFFMLFAMMAVSASAQQVIRVGMGDPIDSDQGAFAQRFKEVVEGLSNGDIRVELFPGGALGQEPEMLQNVRMGQLEVAIVAVGNVAPFIPQYAALSYPYLIETHYDAVKATTGYLGNYWNEISKEKGGFEILGWTYSNFRYVTNSRRPVCNLEDIKGLRIRVPQNRVILASFRAWGANPVPMAWAETFTALQQRVVDGQENPYIVNYTMKFHEVQDYITETHYQYSLQPMIIGVNTLKNMDDETREIIIRAGIEAQQYGLLFQVLEAEKAKEAMQAEGVEVCELEDEDKWREIAMEKVWPEYYDFVGGKEVIDTMREHLGK
ncbi:TRAP transporter substrate-binding protein [Desulfonatronospira sp.]|uniref:TRAP transporter substrate-binding protein n=1 Tax=Desulfonatronospira sp. TaxID=1962951 RepID=UPI0025BDAC19|nr:TRAP transporter substrate-binding protein [Desulfonatronospira sp.]